MASTAIHLTRGFKMPASSIDFSIFFFKRHLNEGWLILLRHFIISSRYSSPLLFLYNAGNKLKSDVNST